MSMYRWTGGEGKLMASGYERSTAPPELFGEPDNEECPHGVPVGMGYECWECRYEKLFDDYTIELEAAVDAEDRADRLAVVADALAEEIKAIDALDNEREYRVCDAWK